MHSNVSICLLQVLATAPVDDRELPWPPLPWWAWWGCRRSTPQTWPLLHRRPSSGWDGTWTKQKKGQNWRPCGWTNQATYWPWTSNRKTGFLKHGIASVEASSSCNCAEDSTYQQTKSHACWWSPKPWPESTSATANTSSSSFWILMINAILLAIIGPSTPNQPTAENSSFARWNHAMHEVTGCRDVTPTHHLWMFQPTIQHFFQIWISHIGWL